MSNVQAPAVPDVFAVIRGGGPAFSIIQSAWDSAHEPRKETVLKVSGPAKAVHSWVMPALAAHDSHQPNVRMTWDITKQNRDLIGDDTGIAIRWAREPEDDHHWEPVLRTWFTPVMHPGVARFVQMPKDLRKQGLIGVEFILDAGTRDSAWAAWHRLNGLEPPGDFAISCADTATAVDTALATGQVAIAGSFLASDRLASGELVAPFDTAITPFSRFWLVCRKGLEKTPEFRWFLDAVRLGEKAINAHCGDIKWFHPGGSSATD